MTPEERATQFWKDLEVGMKAASHLLLDLIQDTRAAAFEEAAKIAERHLPAGMYPEALAGAIAAAIRQHAKGDGK